MRRPSWGGYPPAAKKQPPPAHGIKIKKAGTTWWGQQWIAALAEVLRGDAARLARGRTYARAGRAHDLVVRGGAVTARVTGSRPAPYQVTISVSHLPDPAWQRVIAALAARAQFAAELLAGEMPQAIGEVFRAADTSLFPASRAELATRCSCPDWGDPCKHVAATHYVLGEALDRDPFLLFELRGRTRDQVLDALRAARTGEAPARGRRRAPAAVIDAAPPSVTLGALTAADYDRPRAALPGMHLSFDAPGTHGAVLRQLGAPGAWREAGSPADALAPLIRAAAERARQIALAEPTAADDAVDAAAAAPAPAATAPAARPQRARRRAPRPR